VIAAQHPATVTVTYTPCREGEAEGAYAVPEDTVGIEAACVEAVYARPQKRRAAAYAMARNHNLRVERERVAEVLLSSG